VTGFNHGMNGAVIALAVRRPEIAVPLAFISHYAADFVPHYGHSHGKVLTRQFNQFLAADFIIALICMAILGVLFPHKLVLIWLCMVVAAVPDLIWWFYRKSVKQWPKGLDRFTTWHYRVNSRSHINHLYFDAAWFGLIWAAALWFKLR